MLGKTISRQWFRGNIEPAMSCHSKDRKIPKIKFNRCVWQLIFKFSSNSSSINGPSTPTTTWQRSAKLIKNTDTSNQYLEHIRTVHDPSLHIKTIEDELKGTIGKALGKQGDKILAALRSMKDEHCKHEKILQAIATYSNDDNANLNGSKSKSSSHLAKEQMYYKLRESALRYNELRKRAEKARWELLVHRQAAGFIVNNHKIVHEKFPIGKPLPIPAEGKNINCLNSKTNASTDSSSHNNNKTFGNQLDWWQRIGRWR